MIYHTVVFKDWFFYVIQIIYVHISKTEAELLLPNLNHVLCTKLQFVVITNEGSNRFVLFFFRMREFLGRVNLYFLSFLVWSGVLCNHISAIMLRNSCHEEFMLLGVNESSTVRWVCESTWLIADQLALWSKGCEWLWGIRYEIDCQKHRQSWTISWSERRVVFPHCNIMDVARVVA